MKNWRCLFVVTLFGLTAFAQSPSKGKEQPHGIGKKVITLSGEVSDDATALVNDSINKWTVANGSALKGHEGEYVTVRCRVDPDKHTIQVLSVAPERVVKANLGDSAFRR